MGGFNKLSAAMFFFSVLAVSGCSKEPPKCSDEEVLSDIKADIVERIMKSWAIMSSDNPLAALVDPNKERKKDAKDLDLEKDITKLLTFQNIRADSYDEKVKKYTCKGDLSDGHTSIPLLYESQLDDKNKPMLRGGTDNVTFRDFNLFTQDVVQHTKTYLAAEASAQKELVEKQIKGNAAAGQIYKIPSAARFHFVTIGNDFPQQLAYLPIFSTQNFRKVSGHEFDPDNSEDTQMALGIPSGTMDGPVKILSVHQNGDKVDDWYKVTMRMYSGSGLREDNLVQVQGWIPRDDLNNAGGQLISQAEVDADTQRIVQKKDGIATVKGDMDSFLVSLGMGDVPASDILTPADDHIYVCMKVKNNTNFYAGSGPKTPNERVLGQLTAGTSVQAPHYYYANERMKFIAAMDAPMNGRIKVHNEIRLTGQYDGWVEKEALQLTSCPRR